MDKPPKIFLVCTGLGHVVRGYETHFRECFDVLKDTTKYNFFLLKGGGESNKQEKRVFCIQRNWTFGKFMGKAFNKHAYYFEQLSFFVVSIFYILYHKPKVIYLSDFILGCWYGHFRNAFKLKYKILFCNGASYMPPYKHFDHIHQLLPCLAELAVRNGETQNRQTILPYGFFENNFSVQLNKEELRQKLSLPQNKTIILTVGAIENYYKRMDYIVNELSNSKLDNYFLLMLGQREPETPIIEKLAYEKLPNNCFEIKTVAFNDIPEYYNASDIFCLASLNEGFGKVYIEALLSGLPVLAHDYPVSKEVLGAYGTFANFTKEQALSNLLNNSLSLIEAEQGERRKKFAIENYSWANLKSKYIEMVDYASN